MAISFCPSMSRIVFQSARTAFDGGALPGLFQRDDSWTPCFRARLDFKNASKSISTVRLYVPSPCRPIGKFAPVADAMLTWVRFSMSNTRAGTASPSGATPVATKGYQLLHLGQMLGGTPLNVTVGLYDRCVDDSQVASQWRLLWFRRFESF